jgi:glycosyltransferase involved in cell wall biosynthesis
MKLSVVTVAFNAASTLADTLESVARQRDVEFEHWLVDGGSSDDTRAIVDRHGAHLAGFFSEPDRGLYDAMNKGAARSRGDVIGFLNADDWYAAPDALAAVALAFKTGANLVYGDIDLVAAAPPFATFRAWRDATRLPTDFFRFGWQPAHPATFVTRALFERVGGFDLRYRIAADYAFLARALTEAGVTLAHVPRTLVNMRVGGASTKSWRAVWRANVECASALSELGRWPWGTIALKVLRKLPQLAASSQTGSGRTWRPWVAEAESATN